MEYVNPNTLTPNPQNPRSIKADKFRSLVRSIRAFPQMLEARPIVVNSDGVVLGGNMRLRAAIKAGLHLVPVYRADWSSSQDEEFIIKDNVSSGDWDWDLLANDWDPGDVNDWGLDIWEPDPDPKEEKKDTEKCECCGK